MFQQAIARAIPGLLLPLSVVSVLAQSRATCAFGESFSGTALPADWIASPAEVERLNPDGSGSGQFTAPWSVGTAAQANAAGYFPVPDEPEGNTFVMANDDAPPCDCAMDDVSLFSPFYDLSGTPSAALSYRVYHDGRPFNGQARLEGSSNGEEWTVLDNIPPVLGAWQQRTVDLGAFTGSVQLRFRYDDNGDWASGLAVDDICIFSRPQSDLALTGAWLGDPTTSAFNTAVRTLGYSRIPLEQVLPLRLSARIRNNGLGVATAVRLEAAITTDAGAQTFSAVVCEELQPLHDTTITWETPFTDSEAGDVSLTLSVSALDPDDEPSDNAAALAYVVTSADEGGSTMGLDNDLATTVCGTDDGFSAGCRYELVGNASVVHGISVRLGTGTLAGSRVHALLMDDGLNLLSSSAGHTVSDEDLALSFSGGSVYIPLDSAVSVDGPQDVVALVRCLPDSGAVRIASGGAVPQGAAFLITSSDLLIAYPGAAPIVRIHLSSPLVTGTPAPLRSAPRTMRLMQEPGSDRILLLGLEELAAPLLAEVFNGTGQLIWQGAPERWGQGRYAIGLHDPAPGAYTIRVVCADGPLTGKVLLAR